MFEINDKYYFSDLGLKHAMMPYQANDIGKIFENLVYNHLVYNDYQVFVGKFQDREINLVARKGNDTKYIQVANQITNEKVIEREYGNLLKIDDNYDKMVISADEFAADYKGIRHLKIRDFLSNSI